MHISSENQQIYRLLIDGVADYAIYMLSPEGHVNSWNTGAERIKGYCSSEILGCHFSCFYGQDDRIAGIPSRNLDCARQTGRCEGEGWRLRKDGSRFWASVVIHAIHIDGKLVGFAKITRDLTEQRQHDLAMQDVLAQLHLVLAAVPYGACLIDEHRRLLFWNPAFARLFATERNVIEGADLVDLIQTDEGHDESVRIGLAELFCPTYRDDGAFELSFGKSHLSMVVKQADEAHAVVTFQDITERVDQQKAILHKSRLDVLTDLGNRTGFLARIEQKLRPSASAEPEGCTVIYLDLDKFKAINDTLGHLAGDKVLQETSRRIVQAINSADAAFRLGGDEFVVIPAARLCRTSAAALGERLRAEIERPFMYGGRHIDISASIGIASTVDANATPDQLIGNADIALYRAKKDGGNACRQYDAEMGLTVLKQRAIEVRLRNALVAGEFELFYQPICEAKTGEITGFEALIRWVQSKDAIVPPDDFLPLADELGLMTDIGVWALETACCEAASWPDHFFVAVNVSASQIQDDRFVEVVKGALAKSGIHPSRLEVELTEKSMMSDAERSLYVLRQLRNLGVLVAVDDFGAGHSLLGLLQMLLFTRIKIDRRFINDLATNAHSMAIVRGLVRISKDLGMAITAAGVETEQQRGFLVEESCQAIQGFLVARPMPQGAMAEFIECYSMKGSGLGPSTVSKTNVGKCGRDRQER